jgi:hypothetical protein
MTQGGAGHQTSQQNTGKGRRDDNHDEEDEDNHDEDGRRH